MSTLTTAHGLRYPDGNEKVKDGRTAIQHLAEDTGALIYNSGKSIIATEQTYTDVNYGLMTTPDLVSGVELPSDGLIAIFFQAAMKQTHDTAAAAIFIGSNQLKIGTGDEAAPAVQGVGAGDFSSYGPLSTSALGLVGAAGAPYTGDVTTGQVLGVRALGGGPCYVFAAAGTYDVSVQFKCGLSSSSLNVKQRKLWVWTLPL